MLFDLFCTVGGRPYDSPSLLMPGTDMQRVSCRFFTIRQSGILHTSSPVSCRHRYASEFPLVILLRVICPQNKKIEDS